MNALHRRFFRFSAICGLALMFGCESRAEPLSQGRPTNEKAAAPVSAGAELTAGQVVTLEFEPPPEFYEKSSDGTHIITGFRVGYFLASSGPTRGKREPRPLRAVFIARDAVEVPGAGQGSGKTVRLSFRAEPVRAGNARVVFRVQALRPGAEGWWSEPTPPVTLPEVVSAPRRAGPDLEALTKAQPALLEALRALEANGAEHQPPPGQKNLLYQAFRRVSDLATAVVICRDHGVPCQALAAAMVGPPRQSLQRALREWKDPKQIPALIREARAGSKGLVKAVPRKKR
jgi:hypothetical protein